MEINNELWSQFDFSDVDTTVKNMSLPDFESFSELVKRLATGDISSAFAELKKIGMDMVIPGFSQCRELFIKLMLVGILGVLLYNLALLVKNNCVSDMTGYLIYLITMILLMDAFDVIMNAAGMQMVFMREFLSALIPAFCLSLSLSNGVVSAGVNYEMLLLLLGGVNYIMQTLLYPMLKCYLFLVLMNGLDSKGRVKELKSLFLAVVNFLIRIALIVTISVSGLQNLMSVQTDGLKKTILTKAVSSIPGIGDASDAVTTVLLRSASLIKSSIGTAAIIILILGCFRPVFLILLFMITIRIAAALVGVVGNIKLAGVLKDAAKGVEAALRISFLSVFIFIVIISETLFISSA